MKRILPSLISRTMFLPPFVFFIEIFFSSNVFFFLSSFDVSQHFFLFACDQLKMRAVSCVSLILLSGSVFQIVSATTYNCSSSSFCGCSVNSATLTKIVGGEYAASQTWGWAVSLRYVYTGAHFCGGSIISSSHILTAAHCTVDKYPISIRIYVGSISLSQTVQSRSVSKIYIHPSYSTTTYLNDISILKLSSPLDLSTPGVDLVCLPTVKQSVLNSGEYPAPNTSVTARQNRFVYDLSLLLDLQLVAIGWGVTSSGSQTVSSVLQQVTVQAVAATTTYCRNAGIASPSTRFCAGTMPQGGKGKYHCAARFLLLSV